MTYITENYDAPGLAIEWRSREALEDAAEQAFERSLPQRAQDAREALEINAERFGDWLSTHGSSTETEVTFHLAPRDLGRFMDFASTLTACELLMYALQHALAYPDKAAHCMELLRCKYVRDCMKADGWHEDYAS